MQWYCFKQVGNGEGRAGEEGFTQNIVDFLSSKSWGAYRLMYPPEPHNIAHKYIGERINNHPLSYECIPKRERKIGKRRVKISPV